MTLSPTRILTVLASLALSITMSAQNVSISGQVLDASNGEPVIGAGVLISSGGGTVTDYNGKYVISAPMGAEIVFSS
ncbi:MAG: carboxypeptidase-like regulatory domain-containing protein, partial [Bacteroidales bacterium]|nr:carboxypeptidase-like regulatory domain-containing protein [Bacteroidales bacterium]